MDRVYGNKENNQAGFKCNGDDAQRQDECKTECSSKAPTIDDFSLDKPISRGAFGKVFLGHKKSCPDKLYAIKVMKKSDMINKNLVNQVIAERDAMASTFCPYIVKLFYSLQSKQNIYLIMEYLIGGDVKSLLTIYGYFDEDMAILYAAEVIQALEYLHKRGIIHRDIKPDNMLVSSTGHIKLTDFGLSKITLKPEVAPREMVNTPGGGVSQQDYRTPGQILSLASSLAFSVPRSTKGQRLRGSLAGSQGSQGSRGQLSHIGPSPFRKGTPHASRSVLQSINQMTPPIKSLTPTLKDSANWLNSTVSDPSGVGQDIVRSSRQLTSTGDSVQSSGIEDDVFKGDKSDASGPYTGIDMSTSEKVRYLFSNLKSHKEEVISSPHCHSHLKASAKQETSTDNTPQLHRTNESLWTSYAARNLRSMRDGSYSEDNDEVDGFLHSPLPLSRNAFIAQAHTDLMTTARCSSRTSNNEIKSGCAYSYLSDEEEGDSASQLATPGLRKRGFSQVDCGEDRHTGMTGVFHLMQVDGQSSKKRILSSVSDSPQPVNMVVDAEDGVPVCDSQGHLSNIVYFDAENTERSERKDTGCFQTPIPVSREQRQRMDTPCRTNGEPSIPDQPAEADHKDMSVNQDCVLHNDVCTKSGTDELSDVNTVTASSPPLGTTNTSPDEPKPTSGFDGMVAPTPVLKKTRFCSQLHCNSPLPIHVKSLSAVVAMTPDISFRSRVSNFLTPCGGKKTPFRTPKSVRRGVVEDDKRILGTPDYLAPELLLKQGHGPGVDWWALGVCLFEFLTGVPPFFDNSPELIFQNILNRDIPWPEEEEALSEEAQQAVSALLTYDAKLRPTSKGLKVLPLFAEVDWDHLLDVKPIFVPQPDDQTDTSYFQARMSEQHLTVSAVDP